MRSSAGLHEVVFVAPPGPRGGDRQVNIVASARRAGPHMSRNIDMQVSTLVASTRMGAKGRAAARHPHQHSRCLFVCNASSLKGSNQPLHESLDHSNMVAHGDETRGLEMFRNFSLDNDAIENIKGLSYYMAELEGLHQKVQNMIKEGDIEMAMALIEANYVALMEQVDEGVKGVEQAAMLDVLVQLSMCVQDAGAVQQMVDELKDILLELNMPGPMLDVFWEHAASAYLALGKDENSLFCYMRSLDIQESLSGQNNPGLVDTLLGLAGTHTAMGERDKAKRVYERAVSILESSKSDSCEELAGPLLHLGYLCLEENNTNEAESYMRRALNITKENNPKGGGRIGVATCALARVKCVKGDYAKAAELYQQGLDILKSSGYWSSQDAVIENLRMEVAEFFSLVGRNEEAQKLWEESLHEKEKVVGANSPRLVVHLQNLATAYAQQNKFEECEPLLRRSLKLITVSLGPTAAQVSVPLEFLATTLHHLKKDTEAEGLARQALTIRESNFPDDHPVIGDACNILATILHSRGKDVESLTYAERALLIKERQFGHDSLELGASLDLILEIKHSLGKMDEALSLIERLEGLLSNTKASAG